MITDGQHLTLVLNCVEPAVQVVLGTEAGLIFTAQWQGGRQGVEQLAPLLATAFSQSGLSFKALDRIAVVRGPGSFTGIRLGLATAAGLTRSTKAQSAGLLLPQCIAGSLAPLLQGPQLLAVLNHARSNLLYLQCFMLADGKAKPLADETPPESTRQALAQTALQAVSQSLPKVLSPERALKDLQTLLSALNPHGLGKITLVGSGLLKHADFFRQNLGQAMLLPSAFNNPTPEALLELALQAEYSAEDLEPLYLRASDAEDNLPQIAKTLGLDPEQASSDLLRLTHADNLQF